MISDYYLIVVINITTLAFTTDGDIHFYSSDVYFSRALVSDLFSAITSYFLSFNFLSRCVRECSLLVSKASETTLRSVQLRCDIYIIVRVSFCPLTFSAGILTDSYNVYKLI